MATKIPADAIIADEMHDTDRAPYLRCETCGKVYSRRTIGKHHRMIGH